MSLDKSRIPKSGNSSRKFIPEEQRKSMTDPFLERIKRTRNGHGSWFQAEWLKREVKRPQKREKECWKWRSTRTRPCKTTKECMVWKGERQKASE